MALSDIFNSIGNAVGGTMKNANYALSDLYPSSHIVNQPPAQPVYNIPPVIPQKHRQVFIDEAQKAGVTPDQFGTIAAREQGATTTPLKAKLVGSVDSTDRGVMQVNKMMEPLIQQRFKTELGRSYNPNSAVDSIIAARMTLQENKRQFEQMKTNGTYTQPYTSQDLVDSYNTGVTGFVKAKQGNKAKQERLARYQNAGQ